MARVAQHGGMQTRYVDGLTIRVLTDGDTRTVEEMFSRLGSRSRKARFASGKPVLSKSELRVLARVDADHHALVGYVDGDPRPAAIARLVRAGSSAEIALEVADEYQGRGIGSTLARELAADARAAGITTFVATVYGENPRALSLLRKFAASLDVRWRGAERELTVGIES